MCADEEAARQLHLQINGSRRRHQRGSPDQAELAVSPKAGSRGVTQSLDADTIQTGKSSTP